MQEMDEGLMNYMLSSAYKNHRNAIKNQQPLPVDDLNSAEAIKISEELIAVLAKHNLSYKNAYRVSLALTSALAAGGIELYKNEY